MPARKWSDETKALALAVYATAGGPAAEQRTGVPAATIRTWARRTSQAIERAAGPEVVLASSSVPWSQRRPAVVAELGSLVELALSRVRIAFEAGRMRDARDGAVALAILTDKAQLLSGAATDRTESFSVHASAEDVQAQIARLEEELGYR